MRKHPRRPRIGRIALSLSSLALLGAPATASANVYTDTPDFHVGPSIATYGAYLATSSSGVQYRWLDSPWKATHITTASCYDNSMFGDVYYSAGYTSYQVIGWLSNGTCFNLRGRTAAGQGYMSYYDGRLFR